MRRARNTFSFSVLVRVSDDHPESEVGITGGDRLRVIHGTDVVQALGHEVGDRDRVSRGGC